MGSIKNEVRQIYRERLGKEFDEVKFNRLWKTTTQHVRRVTKGKYFNTSQEAKRHLLKQTNVLDYAYAMGGVRGKREQIIEEYIKPIIEERTKNFIDKWGNYEISGHRLNTYKKWYMEGKISKEEYYKKIDLFKQTNKKYNKVGS